LEEAAAEERQIAAGERGKEGGRGKKKTLVPNGHKGKRAPAARDKVAKATGTRRSPGLWPHIQRDAHLGLEIKAVKL
jgi:hypothetical protein